MVDKLAAKDYVAQRIGEQYIIPTLGVWDSAENIDWDSLPNQFVLKTTHGGGGCGVVVCKDKSSFDKEKVSRIFSNVLWARCLLTILSGLLLLIAVLTVPYLRENADIIFVTFLLVPGHILFPEWFFQAIEKMKYTTIFNLLIKLVFTMAVFIFFHEKEDYIIRHFFLQSVS